ncbi:hypothetical protein VB620_06655 [Nodularia harveyana UHCC-0300]|uniref:Uncharacterized protein n=1 Tax=Nodularia harveyana UHCC-0300 TaxID=2974287 RepID=A0ABU5UCZ4_9CYAN|nr:hypothetical protein [Nodularia harveyana]MEA5581019.1 hypothetical protein [Nodularia harveyana UHCC-0300]
MANIQIADLTQVENQFDELSDMELENVVGGDCVIFIVPVFVSINIISISFSFNP